MATGCGSGYISVAPNSVPIASTTSADASSCLSGFMPRFPVRPSGWPGCRMPLPLIVMNTGASRRSARTRMSSAASWAPPPAMINGRLAPASSAAAATIRPASGAGLPGSVQAAGLLSSTCATITSSGISICTGRGREEENTAKAQARISGSWVGARMVWLKAVTPETRPCCDGSSCNAPWRMPSCSRASTLEITSIGTESP